MAKDEIDRAARAGAGDVAGASKQQEVAALLKKMKVVEEATEKAAATDNSEATVSNDAQPEQVASADSIFASDAAPVETASASGLAATDAGGAESGISTGTLLAIGGVALVGGGIAIAANNDSGGGGGKGAGIKTVVADSASVAEGDAVTFTITGKPGATVSYTLGGTSNASDYNTSGTGSVTLDSNGVGTVVIQTLDDNQNEGTETLTLTAGGVTASVNITDLAEGTVRLTSLIEDVSGSLFIANQVYTPGGNDLVNSLQDGDVLRGTGTDGKNTVKVQIGESNDATSSFITPEMHNVNIVDLQVLASGEDAILSLLNSDGVHEVNINRISSDNSFTAVIDIKEETDDLSLSNATRAGQVEFNYAEGELEGHDDQISLELNNVRASALLLTQGDYFGPNGDVPEDEGFSFEQLDVTVSGSTNIDFVYLAPNREEDETDNTAQTVNITANAALEINGLVAPGVDFLNLTANAEIVIAADEDNFGIGDSFEAYYEGGFYGGALFDPFGSPDTIENNNGIFTPELLELTITGDSDVIIDGLDGGLVGYGGFIDLDYLEASDIAPYTDVVGVDVDASTLTGNLHLAMSQIVAGHDGSSVVSGSGNDIIVAYGEDTGNNAYTTYDDFYNDGEYTLLFGGEEYTLGGTYGEYGDSYLGLLAADISTGAGDDQVWAGDIDGDVVLDFAHTAQINTGTGNDIVRGGDLRADSDTDTDSQLLGDVERATIVTGDGDDEVHVGALYAGEDWDHGVLDDANADDLFVVSAASIDTGNGNDKISTDWLAENAVINAGAGNDDVVINASDFGGPSIVLGEDNPDAREVDLDGVEDTLGAQVYLGAGNDTVTFNNYYGGTDYDQHGNSGVLLIGYGALVDGGETAGTDVMNVNSVDDLRVVAEASKGDDADFITNIDVINLTAMNAIDKDTSDLTAGKNFKAVNDNWDTSQHTLSLDVARVDSDLDTINLISEEAPVLVQQATEKFQAGSQTGFEVDNFRPEVELTLIAQETGYVPESSFHADSGTYFNLVDMADDRNEAIDVSLDVDFEDPTGDNDTFVLKVLAGSGEFDLDLNIRQDKDGISGMGPDTDRAVEHAVLNFEDAGSHAIHMSGFGDAQQSGPVDPVTHGNDIATSLTITSAAVLGSAKASDGKGGYTSGANEVFHVYHVTADTISAVINADVRLSFDHDMNDAYDVNDLDSEYVVYTDHRNEYTITTGAGNDWVDMTTDNVDGDDSIDLGGGRNTLVVANDLVINDVLNADEIFENIKNVQVLTLAGDTWNDSIHENAGVFGTNGEIDLWLQNDALKTGIDTLNLVPLTNSFDGDSINDAEVNLVIDQQFTRDLAINISSVNTGAELYVMNVSGVDLDIAAKVNDQVQTVIHFEDNPGGMTPTKGAGNDGVGNVDIVLNLDNTFDSTAETAPYYFEIANGGAQVDIYNQSDKHAQINSLTINANASTGFAADDVYGNQPFNIAALVTVDDDWNLEGTLKIDGSGIAVHNDYAAVPGTLPYEFSFNEGLVVDGLDEDDAVLNIIGSDNDDAFRLWGASDVGDTIDGKGGDDLIFGGRGDDTLTGGTGSDAFIFDTTGPQNGVDTITDFTIGSFNSGTGLIAGDGDFLDFSRFFDGTLTDIDENFMPTYGTNFFMAAAEQNGAAATAGGEHLFVATNATGNIAADDLIIGVDNGKASATTDDIAHMFKTATQIGDNYLELAASGQAVVIFGDHNSANQEVQVFFVDANLDGDATNLDSTEVFQVATLNAQDLDNFLAVNFGYGYV